MISIANLNMALDYDDKDIIKKCAKLLNVKADDIVSFELAKKSIDARKKDNLFYVLKVNIELKKGVKYFEKFVTPYEKQEFKVPKMKNVKNILVVGYGPSGMFSSLALAKSGANVTVIERGCSVDTRQKDIDKYFKESVFNPDSNVIFGEGGAGTFSDGKLTTNVKDPLIKYILQEFIEAGADKEIGYLAKPHIGTDVLIEVVKNIRNKFKSLGGKIRFENKLVDLEINNDRIVSVTIENNGNRTKEVYDEVILAIGHSARDTYELLHSKGVTLEQKSFSMGVRIEHKQDFINENQYGKFKDKLKAADYKLATHLDNGRGVYTFCMCPGGMVIPANSERESLCCNGMSFQARDLENSNSALLVDVRPTDFESEHPLAGIEFQRKYERLAYQKTKSYKAPVQLVGDFLKNKISTQIGEVIPSYPLGYEFVELHSIMPEFVSKSLEKGLLEFDKKIKGFASYNSVLTGLEMRSSSPVRILRDVNYQSNLKNLHPVGEGAGYAGGITSSALDGLKCAIRIINGE